MPSSETASSSSVTALAVAAGATGRAMHPASANDNGFNPQDDALLRAALRLFAEHGLGAGHRAQMAAEEAFFAGDRERYRWWLTVTRTLDRKLAVELAGRMGSDLFGSTSVSAR